MDVPSFLSAVFAAHSAPNEDAAFTRDEHEPGCPDCVAGACVQKVIAVDENGAKVIVHGMQREWS